MLDFIEEAPVKRVAAASTLRPATAVAVALLLPGSVRTLGTAEAVVLIVVPGVALTEAEVVGAALPVLLVLPPLKENLLPRGANLAATAAASSGEGRDT